MLSYTLPPICILFTTLSFSLSTAFAWNGEQTMFGYPAAKIDSESYEFKWPIRKVAIIGAGNSGLVSYREFVREGFEVRLFERDDVPGGIWHYTDQVSPRAPIPSRPPATGDFIPSLPPPGVSLPYTDEVRGSKDDPIYLDKQREHRQPKPVWKSLTSNVPHQFQEIQELPYPEDTPLEVTQNQISRYLRCFASFHEINSNDNNPNVSYNTRVELVEKHYDEVTGAQAGWKILLKKLERGSEEVYRTTWWTEVFDAVVVATGTFNAPKMPNITGLEAWNDRFPERIMHSRQYRRPDHFANKTVLIVGSSASGSEISRDVITHARVVYHSVRPPHMIESRIHRARIPANATLIGEIASFEGFSSEDDAVTFEDGVVRLINGTTITGINHIIFATGFHYSYSFLPRYHDPSLGLNETAPEGEVQPIVTDGSHLRSLWLDFVYIEEPTIGFINGNTGMRSFVYGEYLALALARVWKKKATLPSTERMWSEHRALVKKLGGYRTDFQALGVARERENIRFFVAWLNAEAVKDGDGDLRLIKEPRTDMDSLKLWSIVRFGSIDFRMTIPPIGGPAPGNESDSDASQFDGRMGCGYDCFRYGWGRNEKESVYDELFRGDW